VAAAPEASGHQDFLASQRLLRPHRSRGQEQGEQQVSPQQFAALLRRHLVAVSVIFLAAMGFGYHLAHSDPGYAETTTVAFTGPPGQPEIFADGQGLLVMDEVAVATLMGPRGQQQVAAAGGTAPYEVALVNLNTEDFPNYSDPYLTVSTTSASPAETQATFSAVMKVLQDDVRALQARQGAPPDTMIRTSSIAAPSGPVAQTGSPKRTYAAFLGLAIIASFLASKFLDRHPIRLRDLLRLPGQRASGNTWRAAAGRPGAGADGEYPAL
jgi:hypothetical protein